MARGWESKSVEQQQEEATAEVNSKARLTAEEIAAEHERASLELSRQHILQQLQVACNPRHRQMLERALVDLDAQLRDAR